MLNLEIIQLLHQIIWSIKLLKTIWTKVFIIFFYRILWFSHCSLFLLHDYSMTTATSSSPNISFRKLAFFYQSNIIMNTIYDYIFYFQSLTYLFPMYPFSIPWKHQKTLRFSDVFRGVEKGCIWNKWANFLSK